MGNSDSTPDGLESGDKRPSVGLYFAAVCLPGMLDVVMPVLSQDLWAAAGRKRVLRVDRRALRRIMAIGGACGCSAIWL